jgi:hypothetical protein
MESASRTSLKQSGFSEDSEKIKRHSVRYPNQFDDASTRSDINDADIQNFIRRVANNKEKTDYSFCSGSQLCDTNDTVEDCPQPGCYKKYLNPNYEVLDVNELDPYKKVFYNEVRDLITTKNITCQVPDESPGEAVKKRMDKIMNDTNGLCTLANPNGCDKSETVQDCGSRGCYKGYLEEDPVEEYRKRISVEHKDALPVRAKNGQVSTANQDYKKKYNTLVVNSDVTVPDFIDVLVIVSETPIKITLPQLQGPNLISTVGKVSSTSNLLIKNLSLSSHQIVTTGKNKIDTVRTSVTIEPAGKKTLGAIHDSWVLL